MDCRDNRSSETVTFFPLETCSRYVQFPFKIGFSVIRKTGMNGKSKEKMAQPVTKLLDIKNMNSEEEGRGYYMKRKAIFLKTLLS